MPNREDLQELMEALRDAVAEGDRESALDEATIRGQQTFFEGLSLDTHQFEDPELIAAFERGWMKGAL